MKYYKDSKSFLKPRKDYVFLGISLTGRWIWINEETFEKVFASYSPFEGFYNVVKR